MLTYVKGQPRAPLSMSQSGPSFSDVVLSCIDRALSIVGGTTRQVIYEALENRYGVGREQIPEQPEYLLKVMKIYLGSSADAVEKEALTWIKEASGVEADNLLEAIAELRAQFAAERSSQKLEMPPTPRSQWKLESQSSYPEESSGGRDSSYKYSARFSFGPPPPQKREDDSESREALEAYLRSIVEKHAHDKRKARQE